MSRMRKARLKRLKIGGKKKEGGEKSMWIGALRHQKPRPNDES